MHNCGKGCCQRNLPKQISSAFANHHIDQVLGGRRQHQPHRLIDQHQHRAQRQARAVRPDELAGIGPGSRPMYFLLLFSHLAFV